MGSAAARGLIQTEGPAGCGCDDGVGTRGPDVIVSRVRGRSCRMARTGTMEVSEGSLVGFCGRIDTNEYLVLTNLGR